MFKLNKKYLIYDDNVTAEIKVSMIIAIKCASSAFFAFIKYTYFKLLISL